MQRSVLIEAQTKALKKTASNKCECNSAGL